MQKIHTALMIALSVRIYQLIAGISFVCLLLLYLLALPAPYTGGRIGFQSLQFLTPTMVGGAVLMAALGSTIAALIAYLFVHGQRARKASTAGGLIVGVATPLLCCSPALAIFLGFVAIALPSVPRLIGWRLQWLVATHQVELFAVAALLLLLGLYQNAKLVLALCQTGERTAGTGSDTKSTSPASSTAASPRGINPWDRSL